MQLEMMLLQKTCLFIRFFNKNTQNDKCKKEHHVNLDPPFVIGVVF
jgi:hypothetical protein